MSNNFWMVCYGPNGTLTTAEYRSGKLPEDKIVELVGFSQEVAVIKIKSMIKVPLVDNVDWIDFERDVNPLRGHVLAAPGYVRAHRQFTGQYFPHQRHDRPHFTINDEGEIKIHSLNLPCRIEFTGGKSESPDIRVEWDEWIAIREDWIFNMTSKHKVIGAGTVTKAGY